MENKESAPSEIHVSTPREIKRARRKFSRVVRSLPPESQDFITEISSILTEPDIYRNFKSNPGNIENFGKELKGMGLEENQIRTIFTFFNLPYEKEQDGK